MAHTIKERLNTYKEKHSQFQPEHTDAEDAMDAMEEIEESEKDQRTKNDQRTQVFTRSKILS